MSDLTYRLAFAALVLGAAAIAVFGGGATRRQVFRTAAHAAVCVIGAVGYFALMVGQRQNELFGWELATRSISWIFVVPLLILSVAVTAAPLGRSILPMTATAMFLGAVAALASAIAGETVGASVWIWFLVWLVALGLVFGLLWQPMAESAASGHPVRNETYRRHAAVLTVLLALFPLAFLLGPDMLHLYGAGPLSTMFAFLDIVLMAGYGLLVVFEDERLVDLERAAEAAGPEGARLIDNPDAPAVPNIAGGTRLEPGHWEGRLDDLVWSARSRTEFARTMSRPLTRRILETARDPLKIGPKPDVRERGPWELRRRKRRRAANPFAIGELTGPQAVPVTFVALTLFVIANAGRKKD